MRMWRSGVAILAAGLTVVSGPGPALAAGEQRMGRARAQVLQPGVDLGVVRAGQLAEAAYVIENVGDATLEILKVDPGCSCAAAGFDRVIAPGTKGRLRVTLDPAELFGPMTKGVVVQTNDPDQPRLLLELKVDVRHAFELLPQPFIYMRRRDGSPPVGLLLARPEPQWGANLAVGEIATSTPAIHARAYRLEARRPRGAGLPEGRPGDWIIEVRFKDDQPLYGELGASIRFATGLEQEPAMTVKVESGFTAPVELSTRSVVLSGSPAEGVVFVAVREGLDPAGLRVESETQGLQATIEATSGRLHKVRLLWPKPAVVAASLRFVVGEESVRVPVAWSANP
jgi:hypothetical protein